MQAQSEQPQGERMRGAGSRKPATRGGIKSTLAPLVLHLVRSQFRGALIWGLALGVYSAAIAATFTTFSGSADELNRMMQAYPEGLMEAFGITDLGDVENFLHSQVFILAPLALAFFPIRAAAGAIAGSEERGTLDVLLGNPIRRPYLVIGSFLATAVSLLGSVALVGLLTWGAAVLTGVDLSLASTAAAVLNLWPICMFFGGLALLCSALLHRRALAIAIPAVVLFAAYLSDTLGRVSEDLENLQPWSVFHYYGSAIENGIDWANFGGLTAAALVLVALAVAAFQRRDIYT